MALLDSEAIPNERRSPKIRQYYQLVFDGIVHQKWEKNRRM